MKTKVLLLALLAICIFSCEKESAEFKSKELPADFVAFLLDEGFSRDKITFDGKKIYLENDLVTTLESVNYWMSGSEPTGRVSQRKHSFILNKTAASNITYGFASTFAQNAEWVQATRSAIAHLNSLPGTSIMFYETTSSPEILIMFDPNIPSPRLAEAYLPNSTTAAGSSISVHLDRVNALASQSNGYSMQDIRQNIMLHELGHTIGFRHTDTSDGSFITCSPSNDMYSIMKTALSLSDGTFRNTFTRGDILSTQILYPDVNKIIYYPSGNTSFGQTLNVHWHANLISNTQIKIKVWQVNRNVENEQLDVVVPNTGNYSFPIGALIQSFDYVNVTQPDRDTELDFPCIRIELSGAGGEIIDVTTNFTAHHSEYL